MQEQLSVIIPVYNVKPYISRCLDSILSQTYPANEIICIDDGSTDGSGEICDLYAEKYSHISVIHKEKKGVVSARKEGIRHATSSYITFADSDDWIEPEMYEYIMQIAREKTPDIVVTGSIRDYGEHQVNVLPNIPFGYYAGETLNHEIKEKMILTDSFFKYGIDGIQWNKLFRKDLATTYQMRVPDDLLFSNDMAFTYPCLLASNSIYVSDQCFYHYCMRDGSITGHKNGTDFEVIYKVMNHIRLEAEKHKNIVTNIDKQLDYLEKYLLLLRAPEKIIEWKDGFLYPFGKIGPCSNSIVYGAGRFGCRLIEYLEQQPDVNIVSWIDKAGKGEKIKSPSTLHIIEFDNILIAVLHADVANDIEQSLLKMDIPKQKILRVNIERHA